jgi:hypothetical protein
MPSDGAVLAVEDAHHGVELAERAPSIVGSDIG